MILLDTNILVRSADGADPNYQTTTAAIKGCLRNKRKLCIADQTLQEFWVVATRGVHKNGLGMTPLRADRFVAQFLRLFTRLPDPPSLFDTWRAIVNQHGVTGIRSYDVRFVAFAQLHQLSGIMTFNTQDFAAFSITLVNPKDATTW